MTARATVRLAVIGVLAAVLSGCSASHPATSPAPSPTTAPANDPAGKTSAPSSGGGAGALQPRFHGARELQLRRGHQLPQLGSCVSDRRYRLCGPTGQLTYVAHDRALAATLTDAEMTPSPDHTAWLVRMAFAKASGKTLRESAARAADTDEFLLVLDHRQRVLAPLDPPAVRRTTATVGPVTKNEAWDLVEGLAGAG